jgi:hypothetical protein
MCRQDHMSQRLKTTFDRDWNYQHSLSNSLCAKALWTGVRMSGYACKWATIAGIVTIQPCLHACSLTTKYGSMPTRKAQQKPTESGANVNTGKWRAPSSEESNHCAIHGKPMWYNALCKRWFTACNAAPASEETCKTAAAAVTLVFLVGTLLLALLVVWLLPMLMLRSTVS